MNVMQSIFVEKVTLNIGVGGPGDKLDKAMKLLKLISGKKSVSTSSIKRIPTWGLRPKLPIACKVTVRSKEASELLVRLLKSLDNFLPKKKFDKFGNFSFGIKEYIDIPDVPYDAGIGVIGLEAAVTLSRKGFRIKSRDRARGKIPSKHRINTEQAIEFMKDKFKLTLEEDK